MQWGILFLIVQYEFQCKSITLAQGLYQSLIWTLCQSQLDTELE